MMVAILTSTLIFWFTDWLHGVSPAYVALAAAIICLTPRIGPARGTAISDGVNFGVWFMLAAFISMGAVMKQSGFGDAFAAIIVDALQLKPGNDFLNFISIVGINHLVSLGTTQMSSPAIVAALSQYIAGSIDWPLQAVFLAQATAWSMPILPYEIPMMAIALGMGGVKMRRAMKVLLALLAVGLILIVPAQFQWLKLLGIIP